MASAANPSAVLDEIVQKLAQIYPPRGSSGKPMSENGSSYVPRYEFEAFRTDFHDHKIETAQRFVDLGSKVDEVGRLMGERFDRLVEAQSSNRGDVTKYGTILGIVAALMTSVIGGFVSLENGSINSTITALATTTDKNFARIEGQVGNLSATTIPRPELEYRINGNRDTIHDTVVTQDHHSAQIATVLADVSNIHADVERLKGEVVSRAENSTHWQDNDNRLNLLSNRVTELAREAANGVPIADELKQLRDQVNDFQRKLIAVPASPKYNDK